MTPVLEARDVERSFRGTRALRGVSLSARAGEVHALAGANGAGKSTLLKILSGAETTFEGQLLLGGERVTLRGPAHARALGVAMIHQELSLVGPMSVCDNLLLGAEDAGPLGFLRDRARRARSQSLLAQVGLDVPLDVQVEALSVADKQRVELGKALARSSRVLILDEPTSALGDAEARALFAVVRRLVANGVAAVFVSHRLDEVYAIADRITVLRDGEVVASAPAAALSREALVRHISGDRAVLDPPRSDRARVREGRSHVIAGARGASLTVAAGSITALYGLAGAGAGELLREAFGDPARSIARGVAYLSADRRAEGIIPDRDAIENATLCALSRLARMGFTRPEAERAESRRRFAEVGYRGDGRALMASLSGGNQQKVLIARALSGEPSLLLLDEPTRGVDVAGKSEIHRALAAIADRGAAVVVGCSELDEVLAIADRVVVMHRGAITLDAPRGEVSRDRVTAAALGVRSAA